MSLGEFARGMTSSFAEYLTDERKRSREVEDRQMSEQMEMIKALIDSPNVNPAILGKALTDLTAFSAAKGGKRKQKKGNEGFLGASELPVSQLLQGLSQGMIPIQGRTTSTVQTPKEMGLMGNVPMPQPQLMGFDGKAILSEPPIPVPPEPYQGPGDMQGILSAARDVQQYGVGGQKPLPMEQQPLFRDPMEMAREKASMQSLMKEVEADAELKRKIEQIKIYIKNPQEQEQAIQNAIRVAAGIMPKVQGAPQRFTYTDPATGVTSSGLASIYNGRLIDMATGQPPPPGFEWFQTDRYPSMDQMVADAMATGDTALAQQIMAGYRQMHPGSSGSMLNQFRDPKTGMLPSQAMQGENQISTQYTATRAPITQMEQSVGAINGAMATLNDRIAKKQEVTRGPASFTIITMFNRVIDPTSVVREGEFDRSIQGQALLNRFRGFADRMSVGGAGITIEELQEYAAIANQIMGNGRTRYIRERLVPFYNRVRSYGLAPENVFSPEDIKAVQGVGGVSAGTPGIPTPPAISGEAVEEYTRDPATGQLRRVR